MKKLMVLAAMFCCTAAMNAQNLQGEFSIKPMVGINVTGVSGGIIDDFYHHKVRFMAGAEAEYGVNDWLGVSLGAVYSQQGAKVDGGVYSFTDDQEETIDTEGKLHSEYINIPLLANIYIPHVKGLAVKAGVQLGLLTSSKLKYKMEHVTKFHFRNDIYDITNLTGPTVPWLTTIEDESTDVCKSVDFGIPVGLSYEYKNIVLDFGLTKIDNTVDPEDLRNRNFSITLGYRFHL